MKHTDAAVSASSGPGAAVAILLQNLKDNLKDFFFFFKRWGGRQRGPLRSTVVKTLAVHDMSLIFGSYIKVEGENRLHGVPLPQHTHEEGRKAETDLWGLAPPHLWIPCHTRDTS